MKLSVRQFHVSLSIVGRCTDRMRATYIEPTTIPLLPRGTFRCVKDGTGGKRRSASLLRAPLLVPFLNRVTIRDVHARIEPDHIFLARHPDRVRSPAGRTCPPRPQSARTLPDARGARTGSRARSTLSDHRERAVVDEMGERRRRMVGRVFMVLQPTHEQSVSGQAQLRKRGRGRMRLTR